MIPLSLLFVVVLIGLGFGIFLQKGRFCFTSAFRDFIAAKDTRVLRGIFYSILTMMLGVTIAYNFGIGVDNLWLPKFGLSSIIGGFVFGIGMVYGGGCASGTLYRAGEGYLYYWFMLIFVALGYILFAILFPIFFLPYYYIPLQVFDGASLIPSLNGFSPIIPIIIITVMLFIYLKNRSPSNLKNENNVNDVNVKSSIISLKSLKGEWNIKYCGIGLGILSTLWFVLWGVISVTGPQAKWIGLLYSGIFGSEIIEGSVYWSQVIFGGQGMSITIDMVMLISLILGATLAALFSGEFRIRIPKRNRIPNAIIGGLLMGFGSRLAPGCNISNTLGGLSILSISGLIATLGLILGVYVATHIMFRKVGCAV